MRIGSRRLSRSGGAIRESVASIQGPEIGSRRATSTWWKRNSETLVVSIVAGIIVGVPILVIGIIVGLLVR